LPKKEDLPSGCERIPEVQVPAQEQQAVLKDAMRYVNGSARRDIQKAIEKLKH
jgi:hypothetical protein